LPKNGKERRERALLNGHRSPLKVTSREIKVPDIYKYNNLTMQT
jgi:hypothetical protein